MLARGSVVASGGAERDLPQFEVGEELVPFLVGEVAILFAGTLGPAAGDERPVVRDDAYYVIAGTTPVLVHNDGGGYTTPGNNTNLTVNEVLDAGLKWLGEGYTEPVPGSGRYVSKVGTRVFRMGDSDIEGRHGGGPHTHFERLEVDPKTGRMKVVQNDHVYFKGGVC